MWLLITSTLLEAQEQQYFPFVNGTDQISGTTVEEATKRLSDLLTQSKRTGETRYSGFALAFFSALPQTLQQTTHIRYLHAQHLAFSHQFERAIAIYQSLPDNFRKSPDVQLKLVNIYMLLGSTTKAQSHCNQLKLSNDWILEKICTLWIQGSQKDTARAIRQLKGIAGKFKSDPIIEFWINDILLDLYLTNGEPDKAQKHLLVLTQLGTQDAAPILQLIDYFLIESNTTAAKELLETYQLEKRFWLRYAIANQQLPDDISSLQQKQLLAMTINKARGDLFVLSLWAAYQEKNYDKALRLALQNWQWSKKSSDIKLLSKMYRLKGQQT